MSKIITSESELNTSLDDLITEDYALEILGLKNVADFRKFSRSFMKLSKIVKGIENSDSEKLDKDLVSEEYNTAKKIEDKIKKINNEKLDKGSVSEEYNTAEKIVNAIKIMGDRIPIGTIVDYPFNADIPLGYLPCDGREITEDKYPYLFKKIAQTNILEEHFRKTAINEVPVMTSNILNDFEVTSSSIYSTGYDSYKAFDNNNGTAWVCKNGEKTAWIKIKYPSLKMISSFKLVAYSSALKIRKLLLKGINSGEETIIFTKNITENFVSGKEQIFKIDFNVKEFQEFKLEITNDTTDPYCGISSLELLTLERADVVSKDNLGNIQILGKKYLPNKVLAEPSLIDSGENKNGYYRIYSDGYIEQWGFGYVSGGYVTVKIPVEMKDLSYAITANANNQWFGGCAIYEKSSTQFKLEFHNYENSHNQYFTGPFSWKLKGYKHNISEKKRYIIKAVNVNNTLEESAEILGELNNKIETNRLNIENLSKKFEGYIPKWG